MLTLSCLLNTALRLLLRLAELLDAVLPLHLHLHFQRGQKHTCVHHSHPKTFPTPCHPSTAPVYCAERCVASKAMQALGAVVPSTQSVDSSRSRRARSRGAAITSGARAALRLYDMPVSNHSARVRIVASWKGLLADGSVEQVSPSELGGTKSEQFLAINPQGKIPVLHDPDSDLSVPESDVIVQYLLHRFSDRSPSLVPSDSVEFSRAHLLARTHDYYISGATQSAMCVVTPCSEKSFLCLRHSTHLRI